MHICALVPQCSLVQCSYMLVCDNIYGMFKSPCRAINILHFFLAQFTYMALSVSTFGKTYFAPILCLYVSSGFSFL